MIRLWPRRRPMRSGAGSETGATGPEVIPPGWSFEAARGRPGGRQMRIGADRWWKGGTEGELVIEVCWLVPVALDPAVRHGGAVRWVEVHGRRVWPDGTRGWVVELVHADALPPGLVPDGAW